MGGPRKERKKGPLTGRQALSFAVLVALGAFVVGAAFWGYAPPPAEPQGRLPADVSPFPVFTPSSEVTVVRVDADTGFSTRLTLVSLQGLANRGGVEFYLDFPGEDVDTGWLLSLLEDRYGVAPAVVGVDEALERYLGLANGLFVYDPQRTESINIGTTYAGIRDWAIVGPDNAVSISSTSGLPIVLDYARSDWASLDQIGAYDRALRELYPLTNQGILGVLPPDRLAVRDYLIATGTFVFYYRQGPLASPWELSATLRILRAAPRGIPVVGWIETPTVTEENTFIQMVSGEGKYLVGVWDLPNLTVLSAYGRGGTFQQREQPPPPPLRNKTYAVLAVSDGDNLDFVTRRMQELWASPLRGTIPIAWTLNPMLVELAPPIVEYYYSSASAGDVFVTGPGPAGYLYPDYVGPEDLEPYLDRAARYLQAADMDILWLLNAYPAYEVPYRAETLAKYVEMLRPKGIALDFDDQPVTRAAWMVESGPYAAPVVRSTHFFTSQENFIGKVTAAADAWDGGPHFLWVTHYPFTHDLDEAKAVLDQLSGRLPGGLEVVTPQAFFALMMEDFQRRAAQRLETVGDDPLVGLLLPGFLKSARENLQLALDGVAEGDFARATSAAFRASEDLRAAARWEVILASALITVGLGLVALWLHRPRSVLRQAVRSVAPGFLAVTAASALFLLALRSALDADLWTYYSIAIGILVAGLAVPLRSLLDRAFPGWGLPMSAVLLLVATAITFQVSAAFPLAMLGALLVLGSFLRAGASFPHLLFTALLLGLAVGFVAPLNLLTLGVLGAVLAIPVILILRARVEAREEGGRIGIWVTGLALALPVVALAPTYYFTVALRLDLEGVDLAVLAASLLILGPLAGLAISSFTKTIEARTVQVGALAAVAALSGLLFLVTGTWGTALLLFGMVTSLVVFAHATLRRYLAGGGQLSLLPVPFLILVSLLLLFMRLPPVSFTVGVPYSGGPPLPLGVEYALYAPQILLATTAALLILVVLLARREPGGGVSRRV